MCHSKLCSKFSNINISVFLGQYASTLGATTIRLCQLISTALGICAAYEVQFCNDSFSFPYSPVLSILMADIWSNEEMGALYYPRGLSTYNKHGGLLFSYAAQHYLVVGLNFCTSIHV